MTSGRVQQFPQLGGQRGHGERFAEKLHAGIEAGLAAGAVFVPLTAATASWFVRHRSLAVSLVSAGLALVNTLIAPFARWLIVTHDWRFAMFALGCVAWAIILPAALLLRPAPAFGEVAKGVSSADPSAVQVADAGMSLAQALKTPFFWILSLANFACCAAHSGRFFTWSPMPPIAGWPR